jgi:hypothetical protein
MSEATEKAMQYGAAAGDLVAAAQRLAWLYERLGEARVFVSPPSQVLERAAEAAARPNGGIVEPDVAE